MNDDFDVRALTHKTQKRKVKRFFSLCSGYSIYKVLYIRALVYFLHIFDFFCLCSLPIFKNLIENFLSEEMQCKIIFNAYRRDLFGYYFKMSTKNLVAINRAILNIVAVNIKSRNYHSSSYQLQVH